MERLNPGNPALVRRLTERVWIAAPQAMRITQRLGSNTRQCMKLMEEHIQVAYSVMQQRLLKVHLAALVPVVNFAQEQSDAAKVAAAVDELDDSASQA